jgi:hypothetical protein
MAITTYEKQPADVQDFDFDFSAYLTALGDTGSSIALAEVEDGITLDSSSLTTSASGVSGGLVKVWLSGGTSGEKYKVTVRLDTTGGRTREAEIYVRVKEI